MRSPRTRHTAGRHRGAVAATVVTVAALAVGGAALRLTGPAGHDRPTGSAALAGGQSRLPADSIDLDLGPVTATADVAGCLAPDFAADPAEVTVAYGRLQRTRDGSVPVLVLRNTAGQTRLCDVFGGDYPSQEPQEQATAADPVTFYSAGRRDWNCQQDSHTLRRFTMTEWLSVAGDVDSVRLRFVVDGAPGPWFTTAAVDGLAHLQAWLDGPLPRDTKLVVQHRVLDSAGRPVAQSALPGRQRLPGCSAGSVQIG